MIKYLNVKQNTEKWLELRRKFIGSSDAPIILNCSPWKTRRELWEEKTGYIDEIEIETKSMRRGKELEPIARKKAEDILQMKLYPQVALNSEYPWMMASVDALSEDGKTLVEIKCPGVFDHQNAIAGIIPKKYIPQLYHQMIVLDLKKINYFSYSEESEIMLTLDYDEDYAEMLIEKEKEFWECIQSLIPPSYHHQNIDIL